jgi:hypothetical protein
VLTLQPEIYCHGEEEGRKSAKFLKGAREGKTKSAKRKTRSPPHAALPLPVLFFLSFFLSRLSRLIDRYHKESGEQSMNREVPDKNYAAI